MMKDMETHGMKITTLTPEEKQKFIDTVSPVWAMFEDTIGKDLINKVANN